LERVVETLELTLDATEEDDDIIMLVLAVVIAMERQFGDEISYFFFD
jgi:hypothetical protein